MIKPPPKLSPKNSRQPLTVSERPQPKPARYFRDIALNSALGSDAGLYARELGQAARSNVKKARFAFSREAFFAFVFALALALGVVLWQAGGSEMREVRDFPKSGQSAGPHASSQRDKTEKGENAAEKNGKISVYVSGAVAHPKVVELDADARIEQALEAAGGANAEADLVQLNLAQKLKDGDHVHVAQAGARGQEAKSAGEETQTGQNSEDTQRQKKININTASLTQLTEIPGVGPVTAKAIKSRRDKHGNFAKIDDLMQVDGIGRKTFEKIAPFVTV
ncbi:helix-hairpin-helix domain-containing protein [Arcanobacterium sp. S3PF19]|uniref:ComEA family DNA-binding protein n=1 Tax=Arcanobacterium sp. S3PF19 TaxID=1219585 RepID=UPI00068AECEC|nr:helix-hairpin-helix domain-containing protein [Arcanobacterium sp. S3PF19]